jgi:hypothetical protein
MAGGGSNGWGNGLCILEIAQLLANFSTILHVVRDFLTGGPDTTAIAKLLEARF